MANTANYNWPLPSPSGLQVIEVAKTATSLSAIDAKIKAFETSYSNHKHKFADLEEKPTTIGGYGITDGMTATEVAEAIKKAVDDLVNGSGAALDTLKELADALGNDPNFATTVGTALGQRVRVDAAQAFTLAQKAQGRSNLDALGAVDKGVANGVASLDGTGKVYAAQLPAMNYLPSVGGTITGDLRITKTSAMITLQGDGNKLLMMRDVNGVAQGLLWNNGVGKTYLRSYGADGSAYNEMSIDRDGLVTLPGAVNASGEIRTKGANNSYRIANGGKATFFRKDSASFYIMVADSEDDGANWNSLRPFSFNLTSGLVSLSNGLSVSGSFTCNPAASFSAGVNIGGALGVAGDANVDGLIRANQGQIQIGSSTGTWVQFRYDGTMYQSGAWNQLVHSGNLDAWFNAKSVIRTTNTDVGSICLCKGTGPIGSLGRGGLIAGGSLVPVALTDLGGSGNYDGATMAGTWRYWGPNYADANSSSKIAGVFVRVS